MRRKYYMKPYRFKHTRRKGEMNQTEKAYAEYLEVLKQAREIREYFFEAVTLKIGIDVRYTPDFMVVYGDYIAFHEVKGFWRDDARVKIKVAAEKFPYFKFIAVKKVGNRKQIVWETEEF